MKYDVHLSCVVRVKIPNVEAPSQVEAIKTAERGSGHTLHKALGGTYGNIEHEYAEEIVSATVDEVGDENFERSHTYGYHAGDCEWLATIQIGNDPNPETDANNIEKEIEDFFERVEQGHFTAELIAQMAHKSMGPDGFVRMLDTNEISNRFWEEEEDSE